jgi:hypothetical protein
MGLEWVVVQVKRSTRLDLIPWAREGQNDVVADL